MPVVAGIQGVTELLAQRPGRNCHRSRKNHAGDAARQSYTNVGGTRDIRGNPPTTGVSDNSRLLQSNLQSRGWSTVVNMHRRAGAVDFRQVGDTIPVEIVRYCCEIL